MVFRRDSKVDAFQRQISALRHQLGGEADSYSGSGRVPDAEDSPIARYRSDLPDLEVLRSEPAIPEPRNDAPYAFDHESPLDRPVPALDAHTSVIAHTTSWNGNLESSGSLHVHGRVEGTLSARSAIFIAEEAQIDAAVFAASVTIAGTVRGTITCADRFELLPRGRVIGDVRAPVIVIHDGAMLSGEIAMAPANDARVPASSPLAARTARGGD